MPDNFRVGLVQMSTTPDPETNLQRAIERIHDAAGRGAQIVCLPELFQTQYFCQREDGPDNSQTGGCREGTADRADRFFV